jgi:microcystin degradation protein MlrC
VKPGAWPGLTRGAALFEAIRGINIPVAGYVEAARQQGHELLPLSWSNATPSAQVTEDAYERIVAQILEDLAQLKDLDGLYLDLHGAMVAEHVDDGEGEMLARVRDLVGPDLPIAVSLDLHANVTEAMVAHADVLDIYRTYPHVDMGETGARAAGHLVEMVRTHRKPAKAFEKLDFLIPLNWGCTGLAPMDALYGETLRDMLGRERELMALAIACGFPQADIREVGPSVVAYASDQRTADAAARALRQAIEARQASRSTGPTTRSLRR